MRTGEQILYDCSTDYRYIFSDSFVSNKSALAAINTAKKETSIAFAKWLSGEGYQQYDEPDRWISQEVSGNTVFTTEQLYNKFLVSF